MIDPIHEHVGGKIRLYRKTLGMSLEELAIKIRKSKSSVSKYESGLVAVDVGTLCLIAQALRVAPYHLLDYAPSSPERVSAMSGIPLLAAERFYLYHMDRRTVYHSTLRLDAGERGQPARATLFYKAADPGNPQGSESCDCVYHGQMLTHEMVLCFVLRNHYNPAENILLNFVIPIRKADTLIGMISGLSVSPLAPTAHKMLLSPKSLPADSKLQTLLTIQPEAFRDMKRDNKLFIPPQ